MMIRKQRADVCRLLSKTEEVFRAKWGLGFSKKHHKHAFFLYAIEAMITMMTDGLQNDLAEQQTS